MWITSATVLLGQSAYSKTGTWLVAEDWVQS